MSIVDQDKKPFEYFFSDLKKVKPFEETEVDLYIKTNNLLEKGEVRVVLNKDGESILDGGVWRFEIFPLPSLSFATSLFPKLQSKGDDFELQIFNSKEEVVYKKKGVKVRMGKGVINEVQNVVLGSKYRVVILKPYYLPRQGFVTFHKGANEFKFERMLPLDFKPDGKFEARDFLALIQNPKLFTLLFP